MIDEKSLSEKLKSLEMEISTLTEKAERLQDALSEIEDLRLEMKAFKLFASRQHPEFKKELAGIIEKLKSGSP